MTNIQTNKEAWRGASVQARLKDFAGHYLVHDSVQSILSSIESELVCNEARGMATGILVIAESGVGKSSLIKHLITKNPARVEKEVTLRPMVAFKVPKTPTANSMGAALLKALGDPDYNADTSDGKLERIGSLLRICQTKIVAIDDFQDVPARRKSKGVREVAFWLRDLCEIKFPGVVLATGIKSAMIVRDNTAQLKRRMTIVHELPLFEIRTREGLRKFRRVIRGLEKRLPLAEPSGLVVPDVLKRMYVATGGRFDYIMKLLSKALYVVTQNGVERIEMTHLKQAFDMLHPDGTKRGNPFDEQLDPQDLHQRWESFFHDLSEEDVLKESKADGAKVTKEEAEHA